MSGFHKGKAAIPAKGKRKPWERTYRTLTALRAKMPARTVIATTGPSGAVATMVGFKAKPGLGGRRHRLRRMKAVRS